MKYKLIDVKQQYEKDVQFGTCELCFMTGSLYYSIYVLEDENGETFELEDGYWSWGQWYDLLDVDVNVLEIADWLNKTDFPRDTNVERDFFHLVNEQFGGE